MYKIKFVNDDILIDYDGMNYHAAKEIGFDYPINKNEIFINKQTLNKDEMIKTIIHEIIESIYMSNGMHYWKAHKLAAKAENNQQNINKIQSIFDKIYEK